MSNISVEWIENNGSYEARIDSEYQGFVSQSPDDPRVTNPGKWSAVWHTGDDGINSTGMIFDTSDEAKFAWCIGYEKDR